MNTELLRVCSTCKVGKPLSDFYDTKQKTRCRKCSSRAASEYNRAHPERRKQIHQTYYQLHKDQLLAEQTEYLGRPEVKARRAENAKTYREDHHVDRLEYDAAWRSKNPEKARASYIRSMHIRRARLKGVEIEQFSRDDVFLRDGGRCRYCQIDLDPSRWHLDHDIPIARGGPHVLSNAVASCGPCNVRKHTMTGSEFLAKRASQS